MAIWIGQLLDTLPGALVIGASVLQAQINFTLLTGLFLSNYPASLSSSVGMRQQGLAFSWVLWMWNSLMILSGVAAVFGYHFIARAPLWLSSFLGGVVVGADLMVIAETMLPEAYLKGSSIVGLATVLGFLVAVFLQTLK